MGFHERIKKTNRSSPRHQSAALQWSLPVSPFQQRDPAPLKKLGEVDVVVKLRRYADHFFLVFYTPRRMVFSSPNQIYRSGGSGIAFCLVRR